MRSPLPFHRIFQVTTVLLFACNSSGAPKPATEMPNTLDIATAAPSTPVVPGTRGAPSAPATGGPPQPSAPTHAAGAEACKRDLDCIQEPDLHPCCAPEGSPAPKGMDCSVKSVACDNYRSCKNGVCSGTRACKSSADCPSAGYVHPCCTGNAPKEMNCAAKKVDCRNRRSCESGVCSPPTKD